MKPVRTIITLAILLLAQTVTAGEIYFNPTAQPFNLTTSSIELSGMATTGFDKLTANDTNTNPQRINAWAGLLIVAQDMGMVVKVSYNTEGNITAISSPYRVPSFTGTWRGLYWSTLSRHEIILKEMEFFVKNY